MGMPLTSVGEHERARITRHYYPMGDPFEIARDVAFAKKYGLHVPSNLLLTGRAYRMWYSAPTATKALIGAGVVVLGLLVVNILIKKKKEHLEDIRDWKEQSYSGDEYTGEGYTQVSIPMVVLTLYHKKLEDERVRLSGLIGPAYSENDREKARWYEGQIRGIDFADRLFSTDVIPHSKERYSADPSDFERLDRDLMDVERTAKYIEDTGTESEKEMLKNMMKFRTRKWKYDAPAR